MYTYNFKSLNFGGPPTLERPPTLDPLPTRDPPPPEMSDTLDFLADCQRKQELFQAALNGEVFLGMFHSDKCRTSFFLKF